MLCNFCLKTLQPCWSKVNLLIPNTNLFNFSGPTQPKQIESGYKLFSIVNTSQLTLGHFSHGSPLLEYLAVLGVLDDPLVTVAVRDEELARAESGHVRRLTEVMVVFPWY